MSRTQRPRVTATTSQVPGEEVVCILQRMRIRLGPPEAWTQRVSARDERGREVSPTDPQAQRWCLMGALACEMGGALSTPQTTAARVHLEHLAGQCGLGDFNDRHTHGQVLELLMAMSSGRPGTQCAVMNLTQPRGLGQWNDTHHHADVLELLDGAIRDLEFL